MVTILHGTAMFKKLVLWYDYKAGILLSTIGIGYFKGARGGTGPPAQK